MSRLDRKLEVLRSEQLVVSEECRINNELGENVESHLSHVARPHETSKFRLHIEEVGKITSLLLSLSGRLARVENALMGMAEDHPERVSKIIYSAVCCYIQLLYNSKFHCGPSYVVNFFVIEISKKYSDRQIVKKDKLIYRKTSRYYKFYQIKLGN